MKKFIIKLFKLKDISDLLLKAKQKQKEVDDKYLKEIIQETTDSLNREYQLELQEKDSTITMLEQHIQLYKDREKAMEKREFLAKKQIKENSFVMRHASDYMKDFVESVSATYGKMDKLKDTVENQKQIIENK